MKHSFARRALGTTVGVGLVIGAVFSAVPAQAAAPKVDDTWVTGTIEGLGDFHGSNVYLGTSSDVTYVDVVARSKKVVKFKRYYDKNTYSVERAYASYAVRFVNAKTKKQVRSVVLPADKAAYLRADFDLMAGGQVLGGKTMKLTRISDNGLDKEISLIRKSSTATLSKRQAGYLAAIQREYDAQFAIDAILNKINRWLDAQPSPVSDIDAYTGPRTATYNGATAKLTNTAVDDITVVGTATDGSTYKRESGYYSASETNEGKSILYFVDFTASASSVGWHDQYHYYHR